MRALLLLPAVMLGACAQDISPATYAVGSVGSVGRAVEGVLVSVREVSVDRSTGAGGAAGAGIGAAGGSAAGGSFEGSVAGAIAGAVVGGVVGAAAERGTARTTGYEYVVRTDGGVLLTLVQGAPALAAGTRVIMLYGSPSRLIAAPSPAPPATSGTPR